MKIEISAFADIRTGYPLRGAASHSVRGNAFLVQMKDVHPDDDISWGGLISIETKGRKTPDWLQEGDVLFVGRGSRFFAVHVSSPPQNCVASPHFHVLRIKDSKKLMPHFLVWALNSITAKKYFAAHQEGSALPYISRKTLAALELAIPSLQTQRLIIEAHACWSRQRVLLEELIEQKETFIENVLQNYLQKGVAI